MPRCPAAHTQTKAATIVELCEWRATNAVNFAWNDKQSSFWVTPQDEPKLTPAIEQAIRDQQAFVKSISMGSSNSSVPTPTTSSVPLVIGDGIGDEEILTDEDFYRELQEM